MAFLSQQIDTKNGQKYIRKSSNRNLEFIHLKVEIWAANFERTLPCQYSTYI